MVAAAAAAAPPHVLLSSSRSLSNLYAFHLRAADSSSSRCTLGGNAALRTRRTNGNGIRCAVVGTAEAAETKKKGGHEILTLTTWLLQQEKSGVIDAELTIVLSSISMACKQIASLVQRASISNLTGVQGAVNVQGEDQKKLDVVSNEVKDGLLYLGLSKTATISRDGTVCLSD